MLRVLSSDGNAEQGLAMLMLEHLDTSNATNAIKRQEKEIGTKEMTRQAQKGQNQFLELLLHMAGS